MWALIFDNKVIDTADATFPVHNSMVWVNVGDTEVAIGDSYSDGEIVPPGVSEITPETRVNQINREVNSYIFARYDAGTQASFTALYVGPDSTEEIKTAIESVWTWIKTVLAHYYAAKTNILADQTYEWDLSQFDDTDPQISLAALIGGS